MKLINKDGLVAEIKRRIKYDETVMDHDAQITELLSRELNTLYELSYFIKSLEVKEVDLEEEYNDFVEKDPVYNKLVNGIVGKAIAKHFFELGLKAQKGE